MSNFFEVDGVDVYYGRAQALDNVSLHVDRGEIVGVIGPNGAGKTTLLEAISHFIEYDGTITFDGTDLAHSSEREIVTEGLIHCTEKRDLFPFYTVHQNLLMGAHRIEDEATIQQRFELVYELFPRLDERRQQKAYTMSGGEQQMLAIGRALMADPQLLLLDEPTQGLAPIVIEDISTALDTLQQQGLAILLAEQNASFAMSHAQRLYLLETGTIELTGRAEELKNDDHIRDAYIGII